MDLGDDVIRDEDIPKIEKEMKKVAKSGRRLSVRKSLKRKLWKCSRMMSIS